MNVIYECRCGQKFSTAKAQRKHISGHVIAGDIKPEDQTMEEIAGIRPLVYPQAIAKAEGK